MLRVIYKCVKSHNMNNLWVFHPLTYFTMLSLPLFFSGAPRMSDATELVFCKEIQNADKQPLKWKICRKLLSHQATFDPWRLTVYLTLLNFISFQWVKLCRLRYLLPGATIMFHIQEYTSCDKTSFRESWGEF